MKWTQARKVFQTTLKATRRRGSKHDIWIVQCGANRVVHVLDSHGKGEMTDREIRHCASSLHLREHEFKALVRSPVSHNEVQAMWMK